VAGWLAGYLFGTVNYPAPLYMVCLPQTPAKLGCCSLVPLSPLGGLGAFVCGLVPSTRAPECYRVLQNTELRNGKENPIATVISREYKRWDRRGTTGVWWWCKQCNGNKVRDLNQ